LVAAPPGAVRCAVPVAHVPGQPHPVGRRGGNNEDTGQSKRGQCRNIPQCLAQPLLTGVLFPCERTAGPDGAVVLDRANRAAPTGCLVPAEGATGKLNSSSYSRLAGCSGRCVVNDDRGSYPRPVPEQYRLAQKPRTSLLRLQCCGTSWRSPPPSLHIGTMRAKVAANCATSRNDLCCRPFGHLVRAKCNRLLAPVCTTISKQI